MRLTKEQWNEWQDNPVTQAVRAKLEETRQHVDAVWQDTMRGCTDLSDPKIQHFHAACMAKDEVIEDLLNLTYEDIEEGEDDSAA